MGKTVYWLGKKHTPESKLKMSAAKTGRTLSAQHKERIGKSSKGRKHSVESKLKIRKSKLGVKNPNWRGDNVLPDAGRLRARRKFKNLPPCPCGDTKTERHHKDENTLNNAPSNIAFLCRRCHMKADGRLDRFLKMISKKKKSKGVR